MTVLSPFLESSLNFLSNNLKKHFKTCYSQGKKQCQKLNCQKHSLKEQSGTKLPVKPTWIWNLTVLSTFLESSLNFLFNNLTKTVQKLIQSERKAVSKVKLPKTQFERTVRDKIACKTYLNLKFDCFKSIFRILIKFPIQ